MDTSTKKGVAMGVAAAAGAFLLGHLLGRRSAGGDKQAKSSCGGSGKVAEEKVLQPEGEGNVYETDLQLHQYLMMHFGKPDELCQWREKLGLPENVTQFPTRCAQECMAAYEQDQKAAAEAGEEPSSTRRVFDVGCAVGRSTFELCRFFDHALGIDFSHSFVNAANELRKKGSMDYGMQVEGDMMTPCTATVDPTLKRDRAVFQQADACNLPKAKDLGGQFDVLLGANLICRLPKPLAFLDSLPDLVKPGGSVVLPSPYTWLPDFTDRKDWLCTKTVKSFDNLKAEMEKRGFTLVRQDDMPFFIRETARKNQLTVSHLTVWRRNRK